MGNLPMLSQSGAWWDWNERRVVILARNCKSVAFSLKRGSRDRRHTTSAPTVMNWRPVDRMLTVGLSRKKKGEREVG
jgi:hypothetical protein